MARVGLYHYQLMRMCANAMPLDFVGGCWMGFRIEMVLTYGAIKSEGRLLVAEQIVELALECRRP